MSSISAVNPGIGDLLQTFSRSGSSTPLASALSSASVQPALEDARPADLVQLSAQALQLQQTAGLFTSSDSPQSGTDPLNALLQTLVNPPLSTGSTTPVATRTADLFGSSSDTGIENSTISLLG